MQSWKKEADSAGQPKHVVKVYAIGCTLSRMQRAMHVVLKASVTTFQMLTLATGDVRCLVYDNWYTYTQQAMLLGFIFTDCALYPFLQATSKQIDPLQQDCREAFLNEKLAFSWKAGQAWAQLDLAGIHFTQDTCSQHHVSPDNVFCTNVETALDLPQSALTSCF